MRRPSGLSAWVGQASIQRVHVPHRSGGAIPGVERQRRNQFSKEQPRSKFLIDQARIAPDPAESCQPGIASFQQRRRINETSIFEIAESFAECVREFFQTGFHDARGNRGLLHIGQYGRAVRPVYRSCRRK